MGLKDILDAVDAELPDAWEILTGDSEIAREGQPLRLTWDPRNEALTPPFKAKQGTPRTLWERRSLVWAHLWAAKFTDGQPDRNADLREHIEAGEQMLAILVQALQVAFTFGGYELTGSSTWQTGGVIAFGVGYVLPVTFKIPIVAATDDAATIETVRVQMQIQRPPAAAQDGPLIVVTE